MVLVTVSGHCICYYYLLLLSLTTTGTPTMRPLRYGSVCSGVEATSLAWEGRGLEAAWFSEVDPFCNRLLEYRWPTVPNLGDLTVDDFVSRARDCGPIDVLVGGTPCQGFSVAGKRGGLRDGRSRLAIKFLEVAEELRPAWVVWENVPGCLTTGGGRDFGAFLGKVVDGGYGRWCYRVLDAKYYGVPQRRRRVFLVAHSGAGCPRNVLFEQEGEGRDSAASKEQGAGVAGIAATGTGSVKSSTGLGNSIYPCLRTNVYNNSDPTQDADSLIVQTVLGEHTHTR